MASEDHKLLAHHEQQPLCTTRLPYRQGRKLTAVKSYTITNESNHLLIFGVPSINLRQEAKIMFQKFGKIIQFELTKDYPSEQFTETYHARYDSVKAARIAKKMLDTKNFYGSVIHVCYAPEKETIKETKSKLLQRQKDVLYRLKNLQKEADLTNVTAVHDKAVTAIHDTQVNDVMYNDDVGSSFNDSQVTNSSSHESNINHAVTISSTEVLYADTSDSTKNIKDSYINTKDLNKKLDMGVNNIIYLNKKKRKTFVNDKSNKKVKSNDNGTDSNDNDKNSNDNDKIEIIDCTSINNELVTNINLNYNNFGNEIIKKIDTKPLNVIKFNNINKKLN